MSTADPAAKSLCVRKPTIRLGVSMKQWSMTRGLTAAVLSISLLSVLPAGGVSAASSGRAAEVAAEAAQVRGCGTVTRRAEGARMSRITAYGKLRCDEARVTVAGMVRAGDVRVPNFKFGEWTCADTDGLVRCNKGQGTTKRMTFRDVSPEVRLPDCSASTYGGLAEPTRWSASCIVGDHLDGMSWQGWGRRSATGSGMAPRNDCSPSCAEGTIHSFPAAATVSRIRSCVDERGQVGWFYTYVRREHAVPPGHPSGFPSGAQDETFRISCRQSLGCEDAGPTYAPAYDIETRRATCVRARGVASDARESSTCRRDRCVREIRGFRCTFRKIVPQAGGGAYQPVRCARGSSRVNFRLAFD